MIRSIAGEEYFSPKTKDLALKILDLKYEGKVILVIGQPGSGKSVFMSQLYDELNDRIEYLIAIRAELLKSRESPQNLYQLFEKVKSDEKSKILLLDSLDVLAYSRRMELQKWLLYIDKLKLIKGMTIVCTSRSFEVEHLYPMNQQEWSERIKIEPLPDEFINNILKKVKYDYKPITSRFRQFLRIPLHLSLTANIIEKGGDPKDISTLHGLYTKLFELLSISTEDMNLLYYLAEKMIENKRISIGYSAVNIQLMEFIQKMESSGLQAIIQIDETNQTLSFSHQTLIDYCIAWKVINENKQLLDFILEHKQSLFIRPTIRHILGFTRKDSASRLFKELSTIFFQKTIARKIGFKQEEKVRTHIKTAIIADIASWDKPTLNEAKFLLRIFNEAADKQLLIIQFFNSEPNPECYDVLKDIYIIPIITQRDDSDLEYRVLLSFLISICKHKFPEILDIGELLLKQRHNRMLERFFLNILVILDESNIIVESPIQEKYASLIENIVRKKFIELYYPIMLCCKSIAKYFPEKGLKLYLDYVLEELHDQNSKINSSQGSLTGSFNKILPLVYEKIPFQALRTLTDFFECIFSKDYTGGKKLWDYPIELLYSDYNKRYGLQAFYHWYKDKMLEFCSNKSQQLGEIISSVENSKWESQKHLSILCKIQQPLFYKDEILNYVKKILASDLTDNTMNKEHELFIRALRSIFNFIDENNRKSIINCILSLQLKDERQIRYWIWSALHNIPNIPKPYHNQAIRKKLREISKEYNFPKEYKYIPPIKFTGAKLAQSPVPADVLRNKNPKELYQILVKNRNLKDRWDFEKDEFFGSVRELARDVASILSEDLGKYKIIIQKLSKDNANDEYIAWFFASISSKKISSKHLNWIIDMAILVHARKKIGIEVARFIENITDDISKEQLEKLKPIIIGLSNSKDPEKDTFLESRDQGYSNDALTDGINSIRGIVPSIVIGLLSRFQEDWLVGILIRLSKDPTISVRAALLRYLPYAIEPLGWDKCFEIFSNVFEKSPEEYHNNIVHFLRYVPKEKFGNLKNILSKMEFNIDGSLGETYSILMTIYYLRKIINENKLMDILNNPKLNDNGKSESFNFLVSQIKFEENFDLCIKIITNLIKDIENIVGSPSFIFMKARIEDINKFIPLIELILTKPDMRGEALYYILEYMEKSLLIAPLKVFGLLENILKNVGKEIYDIQRYFPASHSKAPLNIINTILECYPEKEEKAMELLDKLIELRWEGVKEYLSAFDRI
jgi:hypothetical protein